MNATGFWVGQSEPDRPCIIPRIELTTTATGQGIAARRQLLATLQLEPYFPGSVPNAFLTGEWLLPDGRKQSQSIHPDIHGRAVFQVVAPAKGEYRFSIVKVQGNGSRFVAEKSATSARKILE